MGSPLAVRLFRILILPRAVLKGKKAETVRVVFLPMNVAMWRYGDVYRRLLADARFEPIIVTAPQVIQPRESYLKEQREMLAYFRAKRIDVIAGYDEASNCWFDVSRLKPHAIFYTQPYDGLLPRHFEYWRHLHSLICYAPYSFQFNKVGWNWDNAMQNYAWRHYVSLPHHVELCSQFSRIKAANAVPVGYFFEEEYREALADRATLDKVWKNDRRKRVIWAPHKSVLEEESFRVSSFLDICEDMRKLRNEYRDRVVFAFKPHPMLFDCLCQIWGRERTDAYYRDWDNAENSFVDNGAFVDLFAGSDAMVHCSGSFIIDYLYTGKPVQYVYCKNRKAPDFGEIGDAGLNAHYSAHGIADIERFIEDVVLAGNDPMKSQREEVYQKYLKSPNGKTFSENVVADILKGLGKL